ncbi:MAG: ankyrin repeat domain-containing protein [Pseudomonadota bacterium]
MNIWEAIYAGDFDTTSSLYASNIANNGAAPLINSDGDDPLLYAISKGKDDIARKLLDLGANANVANEKTGRTPLHYAVLHIPFTNSTNNVLLEAGADVNTTDNFGLTPLEYSDGTHVSKNLKADLKAAINTDLAFNNQPLAHRNIGLNDERIKYHVKQRIANYLENQLTTIPTIDDLELSAVVLEHASIVEIYNNLVAPVKNYNALLDALVYVKSDDLPINNEEFKLCRDKFNELFTSATKQNLEPVATKMATLGEGKIEEVLKMLNRPLPPVVQLKCRCLLSDYQFIKWSLEYDYLSEGEDFEATNETNNNQATGFTAIFEQEESKPLERG